MLLSSRQNAARRGFTIAGIAVTLFFLANIAVSAQNPDCPLVITSISGDVGAFNVAGADTTALSISLPNTTVGVWGTLVVGSSVNANVIVGAVPVGTKNTVLVTASKINAGLAASFVLVATDSVGHNITINAIADCPIPTGGCTFTQGYWKNRAEEWPVLNLTLGTVNYNQAQLLSIFRRPVRGNGLVSLSHQLIAAKLNRANGATVPASVATAIAAADALIGGLVVPPVGSGSLSTASTSSLTSALDTYNNGDTPGGPPHCDD